MVEKQKQTMRVWDKSVSLRKEGKDKEKGKVWNGGWMDMKGFLRGCCGSWCQTGGERRIGYDWNRSSKSNMRV